MASPNTKNDNVNPSVMIKYVILQMAIRLGVLQLEIVLPASISAHIVLSNVTSQETDTTYHLLGMQLWTCTL